MLGFSVILSLTLKLLVFSACIFCHVIWMSFTKHIPESVTKFSESFHCRTFLDFHKTLYFMTIHARFLYIYKAYLNHEWWVDKKFENDNSIYCFWFACLIPCNFQLWKYVESVKIFTMYIKMPMTIALEVGGNACLVIEDMTHTIKFYVCWVWPCLWLICGHQAYYKPFLLPLLFQKQGNS